VAITQKTRDADEKLRDELRTADIGKLKKLMTPLIERTDERKVNEKKTKRRTSKKDQ
jgi:hypothetical protein